MSATDRDVDRCAKPVDRGLAPGAVSPLPLVGREREVSALASAVATAGDGVGVVVCIRGEAGIGKTRLAHEAVSMARAAGFRCAWGAGFSDGGVPPPLWPWQFVVSQLGATAAGAALDTPIGQGETGSQRFGQFRAVVDAISAAASTCPIAVVIDDAHTVDLGALLLARFLVRSLVAAPVLVVVTARDTDEATGEGADPAVRLTLDDIARDGVVLRPQPLSEELIATWLRSIDIATPREKLREMVDLTGGNPLLVHELVMSNRFGGPITAQSIRSVLELRMRRLTPDQRTILVVAAVLGSAAAPALIGAVAAAGRDHVDAALRAGEAAGVVASDPGGVRFSHDLLAQALLGSRSKTELAALHERAAETLTAWSKSAGGQRVAATARHRVLAATLRRTPASIIAAGDACRTASWHLMGGLAYESASQLLRQALALYDDAGIPAPVDLLLETARSELAAGNLRTARLWFRRAADEASDPAQLAHAAVGLGGMWVHEHRQAVDHAAFMALLERARVGLAGHHPTLALRLRVRQAAEQMYAGERAFAALKAAVDAARACGDPFVAAEALSLLHHTMLGPAHANDRKAIAEELLRVASAAGDGFLILMGELWRTIDLILAGDPRGERALIELREHADALQVAAVLFVVDALDVMWLIRKGRLTDALDAAQRCFELGSSIGDADAVGYLGAHMLTIRWLQQRPDDMLALARQVADSSTLVDGDVAYPAAVAVLAAMAGRADEARASLHRVMGTTKAALETSSNWMVSMFCAAEAAALLDDAGTARQVYDRLSPFADLPMMGSLGVICFGSTERTLGVAAQTMDRMDLAVGHFERAVAHNHRLGNSVMAAISEGELGCALMAGASRADDERGRHHVDAAMAALSRLGLAERAKSLETAVSRHGLGSPAASGEMVQRGSMWELRVGDETIELADTVGVQRLMHLLERPFVDVPATDLVGGIARSTRHEMIDSTALRAYHDRVIELRRDIDEADDDSDLARASRLRDELDAILAHLSTSEALFGRSRTFTDGHERARIAVRKSLSRVFDEVSAQAPQFAAALAASIRTGSMCRFHPRNRFPSVWRRTTGHPEHDR